MTSTEVATLFPSLPTPNPAQTPFVTTFKGGSYTTSDIDLIIDRLVALVTDQVSTLGPFNSSVAYRGFLDLSGDNMAPFSDAVVTLINGAWFGARGWGVVESTPKVYATSAPVITGNRVGATLSASSATWHINTSSTVSRQWFVNGVPVSGATTSTFSTEGLKEGDSVQVKEFITYRGVKNDPIIPIVFFKPSLNGITVDSVIAGYQINSDKKTWDSLPDTTSPLPPGKNATAGTGKIWYDNGFFHISYQFTSPIATTALFKLRRDPVDQVGNFNPADYSGSDLWTLPGVNGVPSGSPGTIPPVQPVANTLVPETVSGIDYCYAQPRKANARFADGLVNHAISQVTVLLPASTAQGKSNWEHSTGQPFLDELARPIKYIR